MKKKRKDLYFPSWDVDDAQKRTYSSQDSDEYDS